MPVFFAVQENQSLANRLQSVEVNNEIKSMQEELSVLDDVRDGKLCSRCLRSCHAIGHDLGDLERLQHGDDDMQSYGGTEDGDDSSLMELNSWDVPTYTSTAQLTVSEPGWRSGTIAIICVCSSVLLMCVCAFVCFCYVGGTH